MSKRIFSIVLSLIFIFNLTVSGCAPKITGPQVRIENDVPLIGFGIGTTGGKDGEIVIVNTYTAFYEAIKDDTPRIVLVDGTISWDESLAPTYSNILYVGSNKSILGLNEGATIDGLTLRIGSSGSSKSNIVIRNIIFDNAPDDNITIQYTSTQVWIDHCTFKTAGDDNVDIVRQSDKITLSWNIFEHPVAGKGASIVGNSDSMIEDDQYLNVTYHHNWFKGTSGRNPRVRWGHIHIFNNYFENNTNGPTSTTYAETVIERNYFYNVSTPTSITAGTSPQGYIILVKDENNVDTNIYEICGTPVENLPEKITPIPYQYTPDDAVYIPDIVKNKGGAGKIIIKYE